MRVVLTCPKCQFAFWVYQRSWMYKYHCPSCNSENILLTTANLNKGQKDFVKIGVNNGK